MQSPLGPYGNAVAAALAIIVIVADVASHMLPGLHSDPFMDSAALVALGVVFGTQVVQNGTQTKATQAIALAAAAHARLDAMHAPVAPQPAPVVDPPAGSGS